MQFVYVLDHARRRINIVPYGRLTLNDILTSIERRVTEGAWGYAVLYDVGDAAIPTIDELGIVASRARALVGRLGRRGPVAIVSRGPQADAVVREYGKIEQDSLSVKFFADRDAAEEWLDRQQNANNPTE